MASGEVVSSWIVTFTTEIRGGNDDAMRYVLSGYWVGLVLGRLILVHATSYIGPKLALTIYGSITIGFLAMIQSVNNVAVNAVATALVGFFQAPLTPMIILLSSKWVPASLVSPAISILTAFGLVGSALGPLCIGFVNSAGGLRYLPSIMMGIMGLTLGIWHLAPSAPWKTGTVDSNQNIGAKSELSSST